jgi:hypothetical protein
MHLKMVKENNVELWAMHRNGVKVEVLPPHFTTKKRCLKMSKEKVWGLKVV